MTISRRERSEFVGKLKQFAFEQSPMFREDHIQSMGVRQDFEIVERTPAIVHERLGVPSSETTRIALGFTATRFTVGDGRPPVYEYRTWIDSGYVIEPRRMKLSDEAWLQLADEYVDSDELPDSFDPEEILDGIEEITMEETKSDIVEMFVEEDVECEIYQKLSYEFCTDDKYIDTSYKRAVLVDDDLYDVVSTDQRSEHFGEWTVHDTPDGELYVPPRIVPETVPDGLLGIGDQIETQDAFLDIIRGLGLDTEAANVGLLPEIEKGMEMMAIVECLRRHRLGARL